MCFIIELSTVLFAVAKAPVTESVEKIHEGYPEVDPETNELTRARTNEVSPNALRLSISRAPPV